MDTGNAVAIMIAVGALVTLLVTLLVSLRARGGTDVTARLATIERKLDVVMGHLGVTEPRPEYPEVVQHLEQGSLIQAVKVYRERTGVGLADAKRSVEEIARQRGLRPR